MRIAPVVLCVSLAAVAGAAHAGSGFGYSATITSASSVSGVSILNYSPASGDSYTAENVPNTGTTIFLGRSSAYAGQNDPDVFNASYTISLTINDYDSTSGMLSFEGKLTGYLDNRQSSLINTFTDPYVKSIHLGANTYTVTLLPWSPPGPPVDSAQGALQAYVTCAPTATGVAGVTAAGAAAGHAITGSVTLNGPAPRGGAVVPLTSTAPASVGAPASVFIPEGAASGDFIAAATSASATAQIQASWNGTTASKTVPVTGGGGICWDVDGNGTLNMADSVRLLRGIAGLDVLPPC
jgi:hypothetical protein